MATYAEMVARGDAPPKPKSERHVNAWKKRGKMPRMTDSDAAYAAVQAKRTRLPILVTGVTLADNITIIRPDEFGKLNIDASYQRERLEVDVNRLIVVIKQGGSVPDAVHVAERKDGSWWIVEGQQRFWAHDAVKMPLRAQIHKVTDKDAEERLFIALNSKKKLVPRTIIKGWPGPAGQFIRHLNDEASSPVRGLIDLTNNSKLPFDASPLVKALLVVLTGTIGTFGDTATSLLPRLDSALTRTGRKAWAEAFVQLAAAVFGNRPNQGRVKHTALVALAHVAHRRYNAAGRPAFPRSCARLQRVNWDTIVPPGQQYQDLLEKKIDKLWG